MKKKFIVSIFSFLLLAFAYSCIDPYTPPAITSPNAYLVIEGFINSGTGPTTIILSRTRNISEGNKQVFETNASVSIEGEFNELFTLNEKGNGTYQVDQLQLNPNAKYRLRIKTLDGKEYSSDYVQVKQTPPIDSVSWQASSNGVQIYVNTHDPSQNTRYYRWEYEETWRFYSAFYSRYIYEDEKMIDRDSENQIYTCWNATTSTAILINSSAKLSEDIIYQNPLTFVPGNSIKLSDKYSILVKQFALSKEAFEYWQSLEKNTENLGSIFDPQPSQVVGNIHCINNPEEPVIGFLSICSLQEKRIFINRSQLPFYRSNTGYELCTIDTVANYPDSLELAFAGGNNLPIDAIYGMGSPRIIGYSASSTGCTDCRLRGTTVKPDFWE